MPNDPIEKYTRSIDAYITAVAQVGFASALAFGPDHPATLLIVYQDVALREEMNRIAEARGRPARLSMPPGSELYQTENVLSRCLPVP